MTRRHQSRRSARTITLRVDTTESPDPSAPPDIKSDVGHDAPPDPPRNRTERAIRRERVTLQETLRREAAWVHSRLPRGLAPPDDDPRWLTDPALDAAVTRLWAGSEERGVVSVWPGELALIEAADLPQGVGVSVEAELEGVLRRGAGAWPLAVEVDLGAARLGWTRTLDVTAYTSLIHTAAEIRASRAGDLDIGYDDRGATGPFGVMLRVRLRCRTTSAAEAFRVTQDIVAVLREPAETAERAARRQVDEVLGVLRG